MKEFQPRASDPRRSNDRSVKSAAQLPKALFVVGPTASGKSDLALAIAERLGGAIINADSMQLYRELHIITARPSAVDEARAPHLLYGVRPAAEAASVAWWRVAALNAMDEARAAGRLPIICGGTGMYCAALTQGIAAIPPIPLPAREEARRLLAEEGAAALHARLAAEDPASAARLHPSDSQRLARAWEVWRGTGRGIAAWQAEASAAPAPWGLAAILLDPPRAELRAAIAQRWAAMIEAGAVAEVRALLAQGLDPSLPAMRAHGVPELSAMLAGKLTADEASARAILATGQYTKRQATWFRHHELAAPERTYIINTRFKDLTQFSESKVAKFFAFLDFTR
ncbi:MAG: tRNA (adenosine(37)-N6)-dimethylallyltransferase MiaA [Alphaproteobacteria bacterium]|nr:tRNA (adenosine(37)-N6)-dimethylallyltransferase MiaA [Alphaproteobacteria bacterium]